MTAVSKEPRHDDCVEGGEAVTLEEFLFGLWDTLLKFPNRPR